MVHVILVLESTTEAEMCQHQKATLGARLGTFEEELQILTLLDTEAENKVISFQDIYVLATNPDSLTEERREEIKQAVEASPKLTDDFKRLTEKF